MTRALAVLALVILVPTAGCARGGGASSTTTRPSPYGPVYQWLCQTRAQAAQPVAARDTFLDLIHQPLHELAADAARTDRAAAARLLEAKQALERDLAGDTSALRADLDRLLDATRRAAAAAGRPAPDPCKEAP